MTPAWSGLTLSLSPSFSRSWLFTLSDVYASDYTISIWFLLCICIWLFLCILCLLDHTWTSQKNTQIRPRFWDRSGNKTTHTHTHTHTCMRARTRTHTHTHISPPWQAKSDHHRSCWVWGTCHRSGAYWDAQRGHEVLGTLLLSLRSFHG